MHCAGCVNQIEQTLGHVPGVLGVSANLVTEQAHVRHIATLADWALLQAAVRRVGYDVRERTSAHDARVDTDNLERARQREQHRLGLEAGVSLAVGIAAMLGSVGWLPMVSEIIKNPWFLLVLVRPMLWLDLGILGTLIQSNLGCLTTGPQQWVAMVMDWGSESE